MRPLHDKVLIKKIQESGKTPAGIIVPGTVKQKGQTGEVLAVGPGKLSPDGTRSQMSVKEGDIVYFGPFRGVDVGNDCMLIGEDKLFAVME